VKLTAQKKEAKILPYFIFIKRKKGGLRNKNIYYYGDGTGKILYFLTARLGRKLLFQLPRTSVRTACKSAR
jgi:hypothetical protein